MNTPIYDFVSNYAARDVARLHMPGHKGVDRLGIEGRDITEVEGADVLYEAEGIIKESEDNAAALFGTGMTVYSTEGSSHAIKAMLYLAVLRARGKGQRGRMTVLAARNVHKAFVYAAALLDLEVSWLYPEAAAASVCACSPTAGQIKKALDEAHDKPIAVYITSPDYLGNTADIRALAEAAGDIPLLVDNAHGAYLHFLTPKQHPMDLGAYMCADSAHKTLPVLTGGAYLHLSERAARELGGMANDAMAVFGSTSPSYIIMQSLDLANSYLADGYEARLAELIKKRDMLRARLEAEGAVLLPSEPLKIVMDAAALGLTGAELAEQLRAEGIEPEFADVNYLVLMLTPDSSEKDLERLAEAFGRVKRGDAAYAPPTTMHRPLKRAMSIREALFAPYEFVDASYSIRRVCAQPSVSCPPAIPIAVCGEIIDEDAAELFLAYGIERIAVVKESV